MNQSNSLFEKRGNHAAAVFALITGSMTVAKQRGTRANRLQQRLLILQLNYCGETDW